MGKKIQRKKWESWVSKSVRFFFFFLFPSIFLLLLQYLFRYAHQLERRLCGLRMRAWTWSKNGKKNWWKTSENECAIENNAWINTCKLAHAYKASVWGKQKIELSSRLLRREIKNRIYLGIQHKQMEMKLKEGKWKRSGWIIFFLLFIIDLRFVRIFNVFRWMMMCWCPFSARFWSPFWCFGTHIFQYFLYGRALRLNEIECQGQGSLFFDDGNEEKLWK